MDGTILTENPLDAMLSAKFCPITASPYRPISAMMDLISFLGFVMYSVIKGGSDTVTPVEVHTYYYCYMHITATDCR